MTQLLMQRDKSGQNTFGLMPSDDMKSAVLAENVAQSVTVPSQADNYLAIFSIDPGLRVWVSYDGDDAEIPTGAFSSTNSELNPTSRTVPGGSTISCITPDTVAEIGIIFYAV